MLREAILQERPAVRNAINCPAHEYFSSAAKRLEHVEGKEYKGPASVTSLDDCIELELFVHRDTIFYGTRILSRKGSFSPHGSLNRIC